MLVVKADCTNGKEQPLEALRGVAAIMVLFYHLLMGFAPGLPGVLIGFPASASWIGRPWFGLVNGGAAVGFFFVLSGFVLTRRGLHTGNSSSLAIGVMKRWPRLSATVGIACIVSWVLFPLGLYRFREAAALSWSPWLSAFAYSRDGGDIVPNLWHAASEGFFLTFFTGSANYNSSLWTMHIEFFGSFVAFGLAITLMQLPRTGGKIALLLTAWLACVFVDPWLGNFPLGVALASLSASRKLPRLGMIWLPAFLLVSLGCADYMENSAVGRFVYEHFHFVLRAATVYGVGAVSTLIAVECIPSLHARLSGQVAGWLGRLSFPFYLLHIPVLCSAGSFAYLRAGGGRLGTASAVVVTLTVTTLAAWPLATFDVWWARLVGRTALSIAFGRPQALSRQQALSPVGLGAKLASEVHSHTSDIEDNVA